VRRGGSRGEERGEFVKKAGKGRKQEKGRCLFDVAQICPSTAWHFSDALEAFFINGCYYNDSTSFRRLLSIFLTTEDCLLLNLPCLTMVDLNSTIWQEFIAIFCQLSLRIVGIYCAQLTLYFSLKNIDTVARYTLMACSDLWVWVAVSICILQKMVNMTLNWVLKTHFFIIMVYHFG